MPRRKKQTPSAAPPLEQIVEDLDSLTRQRAAAIRTRVSIENNLASYVRNALGWWSNDADAKKRDAIRDRARAIIEAARKGKTLADPHENGLCQRARDVLAALAPFAEDEERLCRRIADLAETLPIWAAVASVKGLGALGLGVLVGAAHGDHHQGFGDFAKVRKLWQRLGVGGTDLVQRMKTKHRRSDVYVFLYDNVVRHQTRAEPKRKPNEAETKFQARVDAWLGMGGIPGDGSIAIGIFGARYCQYKRHYAPRVALTADLPDKIDGKPNPAKWSPKRVDLAARRAMAKDIIEFLWRAWRDPAQWERFLSHVGRDRPVTPDAAMTIRDATE